MTDLIDLIRKEVAVGLQITLSDLSNLSLETAEVESPILRVGDDVEFDIVIKNNNPFPLSDLDVYVHQVDAVEFEEDPVVGHSQNLASNEKKKVATIRGTIRTNPDDARSAWRILDYVCRVTVSGEIDIPPVTFRDEEFKVAHIQDG